jgi:zinc transporter
MEARVEPINSDGVSWELKFREESSGQDWDWLHFDLVHAQARAAIESDMLIPEFARLVVTGSDESPRILVGEDAVAGVIPAYARTGDAEEFEIVCWHFAMVPGRLITGRRRANRTLVNVYEGVRRGLQPSCPAALVDRCVAEFAHQVRARLSSLADDLDVVEDALIDDRDGGGVADLGGKLGLVRREATRLKRVLAPLSRALHQDSDELPDWAQPGDHDAAERGLHDALDDIVALQDRSRSLQDELTTRLAEETNRRLYIVSIVTTLLMPATFVTGFFGMNTGGLIWSGDGEGYGTVYATAICLAAVLLTLLMLRWKRLL